MLQAVGVAEIADGGQMYGGHAYHDCLNNAADDRVPIVHPRAGDVWRTDDGVTLTFIGPSLPFIDGKNAINDNSVAFILQYRAFRMLFTGDAGIAAERRFLDEGIDLHANVLKVGHHGSAYSSSPEFIAAVHPNYGIISVGRHNLFGHPAPSTVETLERSGAKVYRTDENAATSVVMVGNSILVAGMCIDHRVGGCPPWSTEADVLKVQPRSFMRLDRMKSSRGVARMERESRFPAESCVDQTQRCYKVAYSQLRSSTGTHGPRKHLMDCRSRPSWPRDALERRFPVRMTPTRRHWPAHQVAAASQAAGPAFAVSSD